MEHPLPLVHKHCQTANIEPLEALAALFEILQESHAGMALGGFANGAENKSNVFSEIASTMQLANRPTPPVSLLATLDLFVQVKHLVDSHNAKALPSDAPHAIRLARWVRVEKALILMLRELRNAADHHGMENRLKVEELAKQEGWKLDDDPTKTEDDKGDVPE